MTIEQLTIIDLLLLVTSVILMYRSYMQQSLDLKDLYAQIYGKEVHSTQLIGGSSAYSYKLCMNSIQVRGSHANTMYYVMGAIFVLQQKHVWLNTMGNSNTKVCNVSRCM